MVKLRGQLYERRVTLPRPRVAGSDCPYKIGYSLNRP